MRIAVHVYLEALLIIALSTPTLAQKQSTDVVTRFNCDGKPTVVQGLSNRGDAAGYTLETLDAANPANYVAYYRYGLSQACSPVDPANLGGTHVYGSQAMGMNRHGVVVGFAYTNPDNVTDSVGWVMEIPGSPLRVAHPLDVNYNRTRLSGINDNGRITGWYLEDAGGGTLVERGFILEPDLQTFTPLPIGGASAPYSISNGDVVAGWFQPAGGNRGAFVMNRRGAVTAVASPEAGRTLELRQVDGSGGIAAFTHSDGTDIHSYTYSPKGNKFKAVASPDAGTELMLNAINDIGQVGGAIITGSTLKGYIRSPSSLRIR